MTCWNQGTARGKNTGWALLLASIFIIPACQGQPPPSGRIVGTVTSQDGSPVAGARVSDGTNSAITNQAGMFMLREVEPAERIRLVIDHEDYLRTYASTHIEGWETVTVSVVVTPFGAGHLFDPSAGVSVVEDRRDGRYAVTIAADGVVDASGRPVTGEVELHISPISLEGSPGDVTAMMDQDGEKVVVPLISFKMTDITLTLPGDPHRYVEEAQWGKRLNLAPGVTAKVELPLPSDLPAAQVPSVGDEIPWWWWDPEVGHWVEDATGTVEFASDGTGRLAYFTEWTHFSRHGALKPRGEVLSDVKTGLVSGRLLANVDLPPPPELTCVEGEVIDAIGNPLPGAEVWVNGESYQGRSRFRSDTEGHYRVGAVIVGSSIRIDATMLVGGRRFVGSEPHSVTGPTLSQEYSLDVSTADCQPGPTINVPVCYVGGQISFTSIVTDESSAYETPEATRQDIGQGRFFEPGDLKACEQIEDRIKEDACINIDLDELDDGRSRDDSGNRPGTEDNDGQEDGSYLPKAGDPLSAGDRISLRGVKGFDLLVEGQKEAHTYTYAEVEVDDSRVGGWYSLSVPGAPAGMPAFTEARALYLPPRLEIRTSAPLTIERWRDLPVTWQTAGADTTTLVSLIISQAESRTVVVCVAKDDGSFVVPGVNLQALSPGDATVTGTRSSSHFFRLPVGTAARISGRSGVILKATVK